MAGAIPGDIEISLMGLLTPSLSGTWSVQITLEFIEKKSDSSQPSVTDRKLCVDHWRKITI